MWRNCNTLENTFRQKRKNLECWELQYPIQFVIRKMCLWGDDALANIEMKISILIY